MKDLILFRGLPGAGKSTLASILCECSFSADDFFTDAHGVYRYDPAQIKASHENCLALTVEAMRHGVSRIGVANTFTEAWEMEPYFRLADQHGYRIHSVIVETRGHYRENVHGTPCDVIDRMNNRFQISL